MFDVDEVRPSTGSALVCQRLNARGLREVHQHALKPVGDDIAEQIRSECVNVPAFEIAVIQIISDKRRHVLPDGDLF